MVYELFTEAAIQVTMRAQEEARRLGWTRIGTELLLFGLIEEEGSLASQVLNSLGANLGEVRSKVEQTTGFGPGVAPSEVIRYSPTTERVIMARSPEEASQLGSDFVDTEHLLLSLIQELIQEQESVAVRVLGELGIELEQVRNQVYKAIGESGQ